MEYRPWNARPSKTRIWNLLKIVYIWSKNRCFKHAELLQVTLLEGACHRKRVQYSILAPCNIKDMCTGDLTLQYQKLSYKRGS